MVLSKLNIVGLIIITILLITIKIITKKPMGIFVMIFLSLIVGVFVTLNSVSQKEAMEKMELEEVILSGTVTKISNSNYGSNVILENVYLGNKRYDRILVQYQKTLSLLIGNKVTVKGRLNVFDTARNPGNFDSKKYYMSLGVFGFVKESKTTVMDCDYDFICQNLYEVRVKIQKILFGICNYFKGTLGFIENKKESIYNAIILGNKADIDYEVKELYSINGMAHILAISGLHIGLVGMFIYRLLRRFSGFAISASLSVIIVIAFGIMSGMGIATIRAITMFGLRLLGEVLGRVYDSLTGMSVAGILLILWNPFIIFNSGFWMSFIAIYAISIIWKKVFFIMDFYEYKEEDKVERKNVTKIKHIKRKIEIYRNNVLNAVWFSLNVTFFMTPIIAYFYFQLPTYAFLLNIIIVPLMSVVVVSGAIAIGAAIIFKTFFVGAVIILPGCMVLEFYTILCRVSGNLMMSNVIVGKPPIHAVVFYYVVFISVIYILCYCKKKHIYKYHLEESKIDEQGKVVVSEKEIEKRNLAKNRKYKIAYIAVMILLTLTIYSRAIVQEVVVFDSKKIKVTFIDVGQGDSIFIRTDNGMNILVDGGSSNVKDVGKKRIIPYLKSECYNKIDYMFMTHPDEDHMNGLIDILEQTESGIKVCNLVLPTITVKNRNYNKIVRLAKSHGIHILYIRKGNCIRLGKTKIDCLNPSPEDESEDVNDSSIVLSVRYKQFSMLLTGDISEEIEKKLTSEVSLQSNMSSESSNEVPSQPDILREAYTLLKVAHHGSKYSSSSLFLERIHPCFSIISSGKGNRYGHPSGETLQRIKDSGSIMVRTDKSGAIMFVSDGNRMTWTSYLGQAR